VARARRLLAPSRPGTAAAMSRLMPTPRRSFWARLLTRSSPPRLGRRIAPRNAAGAAGRIASDAAGRGRAKPWTFLRAGKRATGLGAAVTPRRAHDTLLPSKHSKDSIARAPKRSAASRTESGDIALVSAAARRGVLMANARIWCATVVVSNSTVGGGSRIGLSCTNHARATPFGPRGIRRRDPAAHSDARAEGLRGGVIYQRWPFRTPPSPTRCATWKFGGSAVNSSR